MALLFASVIFFVYLCAQIAYEGIANYNNN